MKKSTVIASSICARNGRFWGELLLIHTDRLSLFRHLLRFDGGARSGETHHHRAPFNRCVRVCTVCEQLTSTTQCVSYQCMRHRTSMTSLFHFEYISNLNMPCHIYIHLSISLNEWFMINFKHKETNSLFFIDYSFLLYSSAVSLSIHLAVSRVCAAFHQQTTTNRTLCVCELLKTVRYSESRKEWCTTTTVVTPITFTCFYFHAKTQHTEIEMPVKYNNESETDRLSLTVTLYMLAFLQWTQYIRHTHGFVSFFYVDCSIDCDRFNTLTVILRVAVKTE